MPGIARGIPFYFNFSGNLFALKKPYLINARTIFISTVLVAVSLTLIIYLTGLKQHRSLYLNSLISTTVLSILFLGLITNGLYYGWKLKDDLGNFMSRFDQWKMPEKASMDVSLPDADGCAESAEGALLGFLAWIIIGLFGAFLFWLLGAVIWAVILVTAGILYWIIFRAFRLIFKHSMKCRGNLKKSFSVALLFTLLYNGWIYAIIFSTHYFNKL